MHLAGVCLAFLTNRGENRPPVKTGLSNSPFGNVAWDDSFQYQCGRQAMSAALAKCLFREIGDERNRFVAVTTIYQLEVFLIIGAIVVDALLGALPGGIMLTSSVSIIINSFGSSFPSGATSSP